MTTGRPIPAKDAKRLLLNAWFEAHPNQPMGEGRNVVERCFAAIEAEPLTVERLAAALWKAGIDRKTGKSLWMGHPDAAEYHAKRILAALGTSEAPETWGNHRFVATDIADRCGWTDGKWGDRTWSACKAPASAPCHALRTSEGSDA